jgi:hypothetical protein
VAGVRVVGVRVVGIRIYIELRIYFKRGSGQG